MAERRHPWLASARQALMLTVRRSDLPSSAPPGAYRTSGAAMSRPGRAGPLVAGRALAGCRCASRSAPKSITHGAGQPVCPGMEGAPLGNRYLSGEQSRLDHPWTSQLRATGGQLAFGEIPTLGRRRRHGRLTRHRSRPWAVHLAVRQPGRRPVRVGSPKKAGPTQGDRQPRLHPGRSRRSRRGRVRVSGLGHDRPSGVGRRHRPAPGVGRRRPDSPSSGAVADGPPRLRAAGRGLRRLWQLRRRDRRAAPTAWRRGQRR